jgi:hypothetical protein
MAMLRPFTGEVAENLVGPGPARGALRRRDLLRPVRSFDRPQDRPEHPQRTDPGPALGPAGHRRRPGDVGRFLYVAVIQHGMQRARLRQGAASSAQPAVASDEELGLLPSGATARSHRGAGCSSIPIVMQWCCSGLQGSLKWVDNFGIQILIYVMLAWGLNIVVGLAGLLDLGYVAFYAVGAYSYALLGTISAGRSGCCCRGRHHGRLLGRHPRLPGAAPARRLPRHRDAGLRRDHPPRADQLARGDQRLGRHLRHPKVTLLRLFTFNVRTPNYIAKVFDLPMSGVYYKIFLYYLILLLALLTAFVTDASAAHAGRPRLGSAARGRDRLPLARHQHHEHQADGLRHRRHVRRLRRLLLRRPAGLRLARNPSSSSNRRSSWRSSCSAAWVRSGIAVAAR